MKPATTITFLVVLFLSTTSISYAMPTDGVIFPRKGEWKLGAEVNFLLKKEMKRPKGKVRSRQYFSTLSFAPVSWFTLDFRLGCGDIEFAAFDADAINYNTAFAGGYGFRVKLTDSQRADTVLGADIIWGFQHISVHPDPRHVNGVKNEICMDDWQTSLICARKFGWFYPYAAVKYSKVTLTRTTSQIDKRKMAGSVDRVGMAAGADFIFGENITAGIEGRFFDESAVNVDLSYKF
ncbi:MAG: hypothetical protein JW946_02635 [Candidatus Omnitrophica bacterium]|nr:hypothetical protein [Candidatus Omnitrophota bacterium]